MVNTNKSVDKLHDIKECSLSLFSIDDCPISVPAAGYRNGSSLNNAGSNGNYWSSTPNSNTSNAYNLNFNSGNHNLNNNNRYYGRSVRAVAELIKYIIIMMSVSFYGFCKDEASHILTFDSFRRALNYK